MESFMNREDQAELIAYAKSTGRTWKAKLRAEWASGKDGTETGWKRRLRNTVGPSSLDLFAADGRLPAKPTQLDVNGLDQEAVEKARKAAEEDGNVEMLVGTLLHEVSKFIVRPSAAHWSQLAFAMHRYQARQEGA